MRMYETTSVLRQDDACIPQQYAYRLQYMKTSRITAIALTIVGVVIGLASIRENLLAGLLFMGLMALVSLICIPVGEANAKKLAANMHPGGDGEWQSTTWFENDGIHRLDDEDDDEVVYPLSKLTCAYRAGNVLIFCTGNQAVVPVNLAQLTETDRKSVLECIKSECPKLKMVQKK